MLWKAEMDVLHNSNYSTLFTHIIIELAVSHAGLPEKGTAIFSAGFRKNK